MCGGAVMFTPYANIKRIARNIAEKNDLPIEWLNNSFEHTLSYKDNFRLNSEYHKTFGNLTVYFAKIEMMIAMKLVAFREYCN